MWRRRARPDARHRGSIAGSAGAAAAELESALLPVADRRAAAFFDLDNTILQGASLFHLARGLYARGLVTGADITKFAWQQAYFRVAGEHPALTGDAQNEALGFVKGRTVEEIRVAAEDIADEYLIRRVWPGTRALAQIHLDAGERVWLVTATPVELATVVARRLGFTGALGTVSETIDGVYTGRLVGHLLHGDAKAEAVRALAVKERLDIERCSAYSDSANDIPMLSLVGFPYAINPDRLLRAYAKSHGWRIRDFRTGRKAARIGVPAAAAAGAAAGTLLAIATSRRRHPPAS